jgi:hypothetical protein
MRSAASYSRCVKGLSRVAGRSPRVYYSSIGALLALLLALVVVARPMRASGQVELTWSPSMVKGPPGAPVTIVEFSDYQ